MYAFFMADANAYFAIALSIVIVIGVMEVLGQLVGLSVGELLDNSINIDSDVSIDGAASPGGMTQFVGWLGLRKLPFLVWLILFLTAFALAGYGINYIAFSVTSGLLPAVLTVPVALISAIITSHKLGGVLSKWIPKEQTSAISTDTFAGRLAQITLGTARKGMPAEAVFKDEFEQKHYVMVEPMDDEEFSQGDNVVLVAKENNNWLVTSFD